MDYSLSNPQTREAFFNALHDDLSGVQLDPGYDGQNYGKFNLWESLGLKKESKSRPILSRGDTGDDVKDVQSRLGVSADGQFGSGTEKKVKEYQSSVGLQPSGVVDQTTWAYLLGEKKPKTSSSSSSSGGSALEAQSSASSPNKGDEIASIISGVTTGLTQAAPSVIGLFSKPPPAQYQAPTAPITEEGMSTTTMVLLGVGGVALLGGLGLAIYYATKKK